MLAFKKVKEKSRVEVSLGVIRFAELDSYLGGQWVLSWFNNNELLGAKELRQIADKLDELNGVKNDKQG